ncbi:lipopolysaccharide transport periplasmic protein LptA [Microbulbifer sp. 2205BS26-8]|uniref:lipopolysaccharide transport periplasmic protein LptA n=1 Tax=Microbulbifer sp. 2205BS26-8 TaxID=3064386 RepID=UPI00273FD8D9|nr:lipopolysaccharide transport periplasmic protein LptA [Microbulbifer sp. 2205BS26-8]MDP5209491.1 lipopolysaccharide transport periplasmic protein LptA [Microbulbifer sp. 2205BS26-8]
MTPTNLFRHLCKISTAAALLFFTAGVDALPEDREQRVNIRSDAMNAALSSNLVVYSNNVVITQGSLKIRADRVEVYFTTDKEVRRVIAEGKPAHFEQKILAGENPVKARARRIEYSVSSEELLLTGEALVDRDGNTLAAEKINYDLTTEQLSARGQTGKGRVEMIWKPEKKETSNNGREGQ